jgi:hypothetical protein
LIGGTSPASPTTRRILDFATWIYRARIPDEQEDVVVPNLDEMPEGVLPMLIPLTSPQDEITRVVNEIVKAVAEGVPRQHILVIHSDWKGVERLLARLERPQFSRLGREGSSLGDLVRSAGWLPNPRIGRGGEYELNCVFKVDPVARGDVEWRRADPRSQHHPDRPGRVLLIEEYGAVAPRGADRIVPAIQPRLGHTLT